MTPNNQNYVDNEKYINKNNLPPTSVWQYGG